MVPIPRSLAGVLPVLRCYLLQSLGLLLRPSVAGREASPPPGLASLLRYSCSVPRYLNSAVTDLAADIFTVQVPVPEQPDPDQPPKAEPLPGVAESSTSVPW